MADLLDFQFELDDYVFGLGRPVLLEDEGFDTGSASWRTQDQSQAQGDGTVFGRDFLDGPTWAWQLGTDQADTESALAALGEIATVWRGEKVRSTPGAVLPLRYRVAGRTRRVYGRPRRFSAPPTNRILGGWLPITCDFTCADALHYDDVEGAATIGITPSVQGGLTSPLAEPLSTVVLGGQTEGQITIGGDAPTWVTVVFSGPVLNPSLRIGDLHVGLRGTLAASETVTLDPRPWARTAIRNDGASMGGALDRETYLAKMRLAPGSYQMIFGGSSSDAAATATVRWRSAFNAL